MAFNINEISESKNSYQISPVKNLFEKEITFGKEGFNNKKKENFYSELGLLLHAGINLKNSLSLLQEEYKKEKDKKILQQILNGIVQGGNFSDSIQSIKGFTEYEYYSLKIGEETGRLHEVSRELGMYFKNKNTQRKNILNALSYPLVVLTTAVLSVLFMLKFVVPMFADIFKQNGVELPFLTEIIISASHVMETYFWVFILGILACVVSIRLVKSKIWYRKFISNIILKLPFFGEMVRVMHLAQFTQALALLTSANVQLLNSLQLTRKMIKFYPIEIALRCVENDIIDGKIMSRSLESHTIFDRRMVSLIKVAEETNQTDFIFEKLAQQYNEEVQSKSKMLSTVLEPVIILILGSLVALILIAMYLPMFKLSTVLG